MMAARGMPKLETGPQKSGIVKSQSTLSHINASEAAVVDDRVVAGSFFKLVRTPIDLSDKRHSLCALFPSVQNTPRGL
jgi:hypothetical protein